MDRIFAPRVAVCLYGFGAVALGLVGLVWRNFAVLWQPGPGIAAARSPWAYVVALAPLLGGLAVQWPRTAAWGTAILTVLYGLAVILLAVPRVLAHPAVFLNWYGVAEPLAIAGAGLVAWANCGSIARATGERIARIGRVSVGACLIVFAAAHVVYASYTATLVPAWLPPGRAFWVYATAVGHFAAGIALISGVYARPAAMWLSLMFAVFAVLVHAPTIVSHPHDPGNWAENAINLALIGSAWVIAASLGTAADKASRAHRHR